MRLIDADELLKWISGQSKSPSCPRNESAFGLRIMKHIDRMPSVQPEPLWGKTVENGRPLADREIVSRLRDIQKQVGGSYAIDRAIEVIEAVQALPSVQPDIIRCKDCKHKGTKNCVANVWATILGVTVKDDFYCGLAERRTDETD